MAKNINSLQLLRNTTLFASKADAISKITEEKTNDGTIKLARYADSGKVRTIFAIYATENSGQTASYTIYDSPQEAIVEIEKKISGNTAAIALLNSGDTATGSVAYSIKTALDALDLTEVKAEGQAIISVSQANGQVSATAGDIAAAHVKIADTADAFSATTVEDALVEISDDIKALSGSAKVTVESASGTTDDVLKVYTIKQGGTEVGKINIPKDLVVTSGSVVKGNWVNGTFTENTGGTGTALKLVIANQEAPVYINTLDLVKDHTAGNGISISDTNEVSINIDSTSEGFLTVGADGLKLSGVSAAIASAKTEVVVDAAGHVTVTSAEKDGHLVYTIGENDIASEAALTAEISARKAVDGIDGSAYTANASTKYISGARSLNEADVKLDEAIKNVAGGVGLNDNFKIAANGASGASISAETTVSSALYTLDNAIAAAKKANSLSAKEGTPLTVESDANGTTISVNIESAETVTHIVGYDAENKKFVYSNIEGIDAGTY